MPNNIKHAIGVDLGGTNIKLGVVTETGKIVLSTSLETKASGGPGEVISQIKKGVHQLTENKKLKIVGIGIGAPGIVSLEKGTVENPPNFPGWGKINLARILEKEFKKRVFVENDANAAAIGEMIFGAGKKLNSFVMITLGTGVGGGIILNRKIYRGDYGGAGEIGHITIDYKGNQCNCGSFGCIETYLGNNYLVRKLKNELAHNDTVIPELVENDLDRLSPLVIKQAADNGDAFAIRFIAELGLLLGAALGSVSNLLDVSTFIVGGGVAGFGDFLFIPLRDTVVSRVMIPTKPRVKVLPAKLRNEAGILGASALVYYLK